jgi:hypothetical protein
MAEHSHSQSGEFLDGVLADVRAALAALDDREAALPDATPDGPESGAARAAALGRLEVNLDGWQGILGEMAEKVHAAHEELAALDADLKRSLDAFAAARKHLQGG